MDEVFKPDILKIYYGEDIRCSNGMVLHQPTIGEILEFGELPFWGLVQRVCGNPTSMRLTLWKSGVDWNEVDDFELFIMVIRSLPKEHTQLIFGDIDFSEFATIKNEEEEIVMIYIPDGGKTQITKQDYFEIVGYLRVMFNFFPKVEKAKTKGTKELIIQDDEGAIRLASLKAQKEQFQSSVFFSLISALTNHAGFKYNKKEVLDIPIFEFMDSVKRLQVMESTLSLMKGMYSGMINTESIDLDTELNWTRDLYNKS